MKNRFKDLFDRFKVQANIDPDYGPYESKQEALKYLPKRMRRLGRTMGIIENESVEEYWFKNGIEDFDLVQKHMNNIVNLPKDFYIATSVNGRFLTYKTDDYRQLDLSNILGYQINNSNEIIRVDNDLYITINYTFDASTDQTILKLEGCYLEENELKYKKFSTGSTTLKGVHSLVYNPDDGFIYAAERTYSATVAGKIVKINPNTLNVIKTSNFPNNAIFGNSTTDIRVYNNKLYIMVGINQNLKLLEVSTNLEDYTEIYVGGTDPALRHMSAQPFIIYNNKVYLTGYNDYTAADRTRHIIIVEVNLLTKTKRVSPKISININVGALIGTHWMGIKNDKLLISLYSYGGINYGSSIARFNIKTFSKEEEKLFDFPITDDNSFVNNYLYLNGESFYGAPWVSSYPQYPNNNAKLIKINPLDFTDFNIEKDPFLGGFGSYGSINQIVENGTVQLSDIREALALKANI